MSYSERNESEQLPEWANEGIVQGRGGGFCVGRLYGRWENVLFKWAHFSLINSLFRWLLFWCVRAHCASLLLPLLSHLWACARVYHLHSLIVSHLFELKQRLLCFILFYSLSAASPLYSFAALLILFLFYFLSIVDVYVRHITNTTHTKLFISVLFICAHLKYTLNKAQGICVLHGHRHTSWTYK